MKEFLSVADLCEVLNVSKSTVHKLSSAKVIPTYKPGGKLIYFKRSEVYAYLERYRIPSVEEIQTTTLNSLMSIKHK